VSGSAASLLTLGGERQAFSARLIISARASRTAAREASVVAYQSGYRELLRNIRLVRAPGPGLIRSRTFPSHPNHLASTSTLASARGQICRSVSGAHPPEDYFLPCSSV